MPSTSSRQHKLSLRRSALTTLATAAAVCGAVVLAACGDEDEGSGSTSSGAEEVVLTNWGGDWGVALKKAYVDPFVSETGIDVTMNEPTDYAKLELQVESGNVTSDVVNVSGDFGIGSTVDLLEPIDCEIVPCDELGEGAAGSHRVALMYWSEPLVYRPDLLEGPAPQTWADVFDPERFPGKRGLDERVGESPILEYALLADGVAAEDLYPLDVDRALAKLDAIKDDVVWYDSSDAGQQLFSSGEVVMGMVPNGRIQPIQDEGVELEASWEQYAVMSDQLVIPRGAPNVDGAQELIAFMVSADHNADLTKYIDYAPTNELAFDKVAPQSEPFLPTTYFDEAESFRVDDEWWDENRKEVQEQFQEWLTS